VDRREYLSALFDAAAVQVDRASPNIEDRPEIAHPVKIEDLASRAREHTRQRWATQDTNRPHFGLFLSILRVTRLLFQEGGDSTDTILRNLSVAGHRQFWRYRYMIE